MDKKIDQENAKDIFNRNKNKNAKGSFKLEGLTIPERGIREGESVEEYIKAMVTGNKNE